MLERDLAALDSYQLLPKLLHDVRQVDTSCTLLGRACGVPILPLRKAPAPHEPVESLSLVEASLEPSPHCIPLLGAEKMGYLMPKVRQLSAAGVPAVALDLSTLAETPPFGRQEWRPRTREDLAELRAAAGCPLLLYGIGSPTDAEVATEAGIDAIVVDSGASVYLGGPATAEIFPDILDTVAGMLAVYAGGPVRGGIDIFRYLALGAEAVVTPSDRPLTNLQAELAYAMRLTGCQTLADIGYEAIFEPLFKEV